MSTPAHLHLAWYGYRACTGPHCAGPRTGDINALCDDPECEGGCGAARHNIAVRRHLP